MTSQGPRWVVESRIDPSELQIGHFVTRLDRPWGETDFPLQGVLIDSRQKKDWMVKNCAWVVVSRASGPSPVARRPGRAAAIVRPGRSTSPSSLHALSRVKVTRETLEQALKVYDSLDVQVRELASQVRLGGRLDMDAARGVVHELADVLEHNLAALVWLTRIKERDDYTAQHCINVSILAIGLAHALEWDRHKVEYAGLAGLLHDLGKMLIDPRILNKRGRLTEEEFEEVKRHTRFGYDMLARDGDLPDAVAEAVLCHHERPDGRGYPQGLNGPRIPPLARLIAIVDAYDAITSHRVYDPARSHHEALGILWKERNRQFDGPMVECFTQFLGWVTPGTLVRLTDRRLAVVLQAKEGRGLLPLVRVLQRADHGWQLGETLDLAQLKTGNGSAPLRIADVLPDGTEGVEVRELSLRFD